MKTESTETFNCLILFFLKRVNAGKCPSKRRRHHPVSKLSLGVNQPSGLQESPEVVIKTEETSPSAIASVQALNQSASLQEGPQN
ncbi:hypothetical protein SDJN02_27379, partial [Cucurbita argyrosperma subsp. argyrosperma]